MSSKLSFIIVSYNEREYLEEAITSCLQQNLENFEIIIGDDGSDDGSIQLIEKFAKGYKKNISYFVSERNNICSKDVIASLRVSNIIKRAMKMAKGDYVIVLSGDDYFYKSDFIKSAIMFLDTHPDYVAYVGGFKKIWTNKDSINYYSSYPPKLYWAGKYIHISAFVFRKTVIDNNALLQRFCDDAGLVYSLAVSGKWKYDPQVVFAYRQRERSIMHTVDWLEFRLVELMLLQDVLCKGKLYPQSMAHYSKSLQYVYKNRRKLDNDKYKKYIENCKQFDHDIIQQLYEFDNNSLIKKLSIYSKLVYANLVAFIYRIIFKLGRKKYENTFC